MKTMQTLIVLVLFLYSAAVASGVVNKELEASADPSATPIPALPKSTLRCWQRGKLLFEEVDYGLSANNNNVRMIKFNRSQTQGQSLGLINLGEALCVYQNTD